MNKIFWLVPLLFSFISSIFLLFPIAGIALTQDQLTQFYSETYGDALSPSGQQSAELPKKLLTKAPVDECFFGIGQQQIDDYAPQQVNVQECVDSGGVPKVNQAYVWGLTKAGSNLWIGTKANTLCTVIGNRFGLPVSYRTNSWVCEFGQSAFAQTFPFVSDALGDWRPPRIVVYNLDSYSVTDKTEELPPADLQRLRTTNGLRSAGSHKGVVFLAGNALGSGVNIFAFNAKTEEFIGSTNIPNASSVRKWLVVEDVLYVVGGGAAGGAVMRWNGTLNNPFQFELVGRLDGFGAEIACHDNRIYVSTWPPTSDPLNVFPGIWMSPPLPKNGLTNADVSDWVQVWDSHSGYEPDPLMAASMGVGALASFQGKLYWGTMHIPFFALKTHFQVYADDYPGGPSSQQVLLAALGTFRAISLFRGADFPATPAVELLYGLSRLPRYTSGNGSYGNWSLPSNMAGLNPIYGPPGFGNPFNNYTWIMSEYNNRLYTGTMDWSYLVFGGLSMPSTQPQMTLQVDEMGTIDVSQALQSFEELFDPTRFFGADLFVFPDEQSPAAPESMSGLNNYTNYGLRTVASDDALYIGTANPMNLLTNSSDGLPEGGWELLQLGRRPMQPAEPVPTLSEYGMIGFAFVLGLVVVIRLFRSSGQQI